MIEAIWITLLLAAVTTPVLLIIATPIAWWLAQKGSWIKDVVAAVVALPIVLPPTVLGFYLLVALGPNSPLMAVLQPFGVRTLAFTFTGLVIGSLVYSLPFAVQPIRNAFEAMGSRPMEVAATLRASKWDAFISVALPQARRGFLTAAILVFAHTIGEFGVVLMIGGSIPGQTEVISIRIYQAVEQLNWAEAHLISGGLMAFSFVVLMTMLIIDRRFSARTAGIRP
ncbi:molybdate ABC transporter permease subunit [Asticcacaulis sp. BYS171W]|uniref:Molybdenum transport system permease n=1 Tax=Asticcacaulis aquaticus TaxID=2984212 RepID=A0ABT5HU41_9CAUL|nr:molybdate ABC transporter permease subunit [Asticcacaulis aquaticus]MDC7683591.1 molybdate ABC transporter permease subunit [Asticcacaulis aquaticus]